MVTSLQGEFQKKLAFGQIAETQIAKWLIARGSSVLPVYDIEYNDGKGPRVFRDGGNLIAPDLLVFKQGNVSWVEAKHKTHFSWYRRKQRWETGIDSRHYEHYLQIQDSIGFPIWLLFLHSDSSPHRNDSIYPCCPRVAPTGLFGNTLTALRDCKPRFDSRWSNGMVYWGHSDLRQLSTLDELTR